MMAAGSGWVGDTPGFNGDLNAVLRLDQGEDPVHLQPSRPVLSAAPHRSQCQGDPECASAVAIDSVAGHLTGGNADPQATRVIGEAIRGFLQELSAQRKAER